MTGHDLSFDPQAASERPVVKLLSLIIQEGLLAGAATIELSASGSGCLVRYQIKGEWREQMRIPAAASDPLFNVVRAWANLDRTSVPRPHAGEMAVELNGKPYRLTAALKKRADGFEECMISCPMIDAA